MLLPPGHGRVAERRCGGGVAPRGHRALETVEFEELEERRVATKEAHDRVESCDRRRESPSERVDQLVNERGATRSSLVDHAE